MQKLTDDLAYPISWQDRPVLNKQNGDTVIQNSTTLAVMILVTRINLLSH